MFWADRIGSAIEKERAHALPSGEPCIIRDEKTTSGPVHVGSMRGVAIHGSVSEALTERKIGNKFLYEFNDFDPMDDIPPYLQREQFERYLGMPLRNIPSPDPSANNFAQYFANEFRRVIENAGWKPEFYWGSELYFSGKMDSVIVEAIEGAETIRRIYREVSGAQRPEGWLPLAALCPRCGKLSTTDASDFDGKTIKVQCLENKLPWTRGCGFEGRLSPFAGGAKLSWKVEWPAKWKVMRVNVEGGGKDHSTKGGSRDVGNHISKEVFHYPPPFDIPYEFFLVGGRKMSSSKGRGNSAQEIANLLPTKIFRLALIFKDINQAFNFDPEGDTIPVLYDLYDKLALNYKEGVQDDFTRLFLFAHPAKERSNLVVPEYLARFSQVAFLVQMPHLDLETEVAHLKGSPLSQADKIELSERAVYARTWLELYAPDKFVFKLQHTLPAAVASLTMAQKHTLALLREYLQEQSEMPNGETLHHTLHEIKEKEHIAPADFFSALYLSFLGKSYGPKAGWFLSVLDKEFVLKRLQEVSK